ncbi:MAG: zinc-ribbon domain-containing protein, partial [Myxococcales bacterium]
MRVTCEKCSAPYAVDDRLIPPQGVRAQCPKCRHLQVVRRAAEPAAAAPALAPPAPPPSRGPQFGGAAASPPLASPPPPVDSGPVVKCRSCAVALPDPLDAALGICESCRSKEVAPTPTAPAGEDAFRREVVTRAPPAAPTREEPEGGSSGLELDTGARPAPKPAPRPPAPAAPRSNKPIMAPPRMTRSRGPSAGVIAGAGLGLVLLGGAGAWFALGRPALPFAEQKPPAPAIHPAIEKRLAGWRAAAREMEGTAAEHFERGLKLYAEDKAPSYLAAEEAFRTALILDPADMKAAAWLVASFAVGRGPQASEAELADMRELLGAVKEASPRSALASIARANLLLAANEAELARAEAESAFAIASDAEKAEALVAWGRTYLRKSAPVAREKFEQALQLDPSLKRAIYLRGLAAENAGRYAQALSDYEQRLALDPAQRDALRAVARVHASLGDFKKAREALARYAQQHPNVGEPRILLVQIAYAVERDLRDADARLKRLNLDYDRFSDAEKVQLLTLWTAVAREKGEIRLADGQARSALRLDPRHAPAHFQLLLLALAGGRADEARQHL